METEVPGENVEDTTSSSSDWDNRILCSDGNCIGIIGFDGRCKECGLKYEGELPERVDSGEDEEAAADDEDSAVTATDMPDNTDAIGDDDEWGNRVLCSDGNCIGVIGPDGNCKECGKPME